MEFVQPIRDPEILADIKDYLRGTNQRNYMMFMLGINTGLRISDLLKLRVRDVQGTHIVLKEQKTGKTKRILITPDLKKELNVYTEDKQPIEYLVKSREGINRPITRSMAYKILRSVADEFRLEEIGCHTLRKTFGYFFYQQYKDPAMLMKLFNHSSEKVTLRYIGIEQDTMDMHLKRFKV
ncbi:site-specific integrase [Paenibacillus selenitireducens]|uniref:Site-specific integrase n=1 Tax=Paenibacillus selenitireducens TaxID=1324314 RepID=A0A1T2XCE1_9BACL|nr:site-specific integrase [Paenibacillus selenitireducens]OPA77498.1 site-specific integrase [Paenibacillus selenitireducens]